MSSYHFIFISIVFKCFYFKKKKKNDKMKKKIKKKKIKKREKKNKIKKFIKN